MTRYATCAGWPGDVGALLAWIAGTGAPQEVAGRWLLAHCDEGVVWGVRDEGGPWRLSGQVFPKESPTFEAREVQQLRVFGEEGELMVWRHDDGWRKRWLTEPTGAIDKTVEPAEERRLLLGDRVRETRDGFSVLTDMTGARQVAPVTPRTTGTGEIRAEDRPRLVVRHYFEQDDDTGVVRVALSRLVRVEG